MVTAKPSYGDVVKPRFPGIHFFMGPFRGQGQAVFLVPEQIGNSLYSIAAFGTGSPVSVTGLFKETSPRDLQIGFSSDNIIDLYPYELPYHQTDKKVHPVRMRDYGKDTFWNSWA